VSSLALHRVIFCSIATWDASSNTPAVAVVLGRRANERLAVQFVPHNSLPRSLEIAAGKEDAILVRDWSLVVVGDCITDI
jgi:hypothetical protein